MANINRIETRRNNRYGENIFYTSGTEIQGHEPVEYWYQGLEDYNFEKPGFSPRTSSFTQVIWKSSKQMGVGKAQL